jgi:transitional endoplasmic reticulum ATPase
MLNKYLIEPSVKYSDLGGLGPVIKQLREMIEWPLKYADIFQFLGVKPPKGILISGPPGTGKT